MATQWNLAPTANFVTKTLNGAIADDAVTITLNSTTNLPGIGYIVINRQNSAGEATPGSREVVSYTGIDGNDLTGCARGADNSTAHSHADASTVETMPTVGMWNSLATLLEVGHQTDGDHDFATLYDSNNNEVFKTVATGSAINEFTFTNAAANSGPDLSATGGDTNIDISVTPKGSGLALIGRVPTCRTYNTANVTLANNTETKVVWDEEDYDNDTMHDKSSNTSRITATTAGTYLLNWNVRFLPSDTGRRSASVKKNNSDIKGTAMSVGNPDAAEDETCNGSTIVDLAATDYVEVAAFQTSGGSLQIEHGTGVEGSFFEVIRLGGNV